MAKRLHFFFTAVLVAGLSSGCASDPPASWREAATQSHPWGYYTGTPVTQWNPDGRTMTLLRELRYTDPQGIGLDRPGRVGRGRGIDSALALVVHGRTVRRQISKRFRSA